MGGRYARTVLVDNKPGASGRLAVEELKRAAPDGSTLLITPASVLTLYPYVYKTLSYDPLADLTPVSMVASFGFALLVGPKVPASVARLSDFFDWCKANPAMADCGNAGAGSLPHLMAVMLAQDAGVALTHVAYKGTSAAMPDLAGGQLAAVMGTEASAMPMLQAGRIRALASTWDVRSPFLPQVPTFKESGLARLTQREWYGAFMPKGASPSAIEFAASELAAASRAAGVRESLQKSAMQPVGGTPQELQSALRSEHSFWAPVVKASGFTPEA